MTDTVSPFQQSRRDVRDLVSTPVQAWMMITSTRRTDDAYTGLLTVPLDLAAAGYAVTVSQTERGWCIELQREIADGYTLHLHCEALSWTACLWKLAEHTGSAVDDLQAQAKRQSEQEESAA